MVGIVVPDLMAIEKLQKNSAQFAIMTDLFIEGVSLTTLV